MHDREPGHGPGTPGVPRRALLLAGGALRAGYHAGALCALTDVGLSFDYIQATSGGALTLAMLLSGQSPEEMAHRWATLSIHDLVSLMPLPVSLSDLHLPAIGDAQRIVDVVVPHLGIDLARVRAASDVAGTVNVANFTLKTQESIPHTGLDLDWLVAAISLPVLMPPVRKGPYEYLDATWTKGPDLMAAVRRGCDELWVVWYLTNSPAYEPGLLRQYGHLAELRAHGALFHEFERVREVNERIAAGEVVHGHRRPIRLHLVKPVMPLPFEPEYYLGRIDAATLIALGHRDARRYLSRVPPGGVPFEPASTAMTEPPPGVSFRETLAGPFTFGMADPVEAARRGEAASSTLTLDLAVFVRGISTFASGGEALTEVVGSISLPSVRATLLASDGRLTLVTRPESQAPIGLRYEVVFELAGTTYCLEGHRPLAATDEADLPETTAMAVRLHVGRDVSGPVMGAGVVHLTPNQLLRLLASLGAPGTRGASQANEAIDLFGRTFMGRLWPRYARYAIGSGTPS